MYKSYIGLILSLQMADFLKDIIIYESNRICEKYLMGHYITSKVDSGHLVSSRLEVYSLVLAKSATTSNIPTEVPHGIFRDRKGQTICYHSFYRNYKLLTKHLEAFAGVPTLCTAG